MSEVGVRLKINEIFFSLQGESTRVGLPTVFVRLTGCPLRCRWCDTEHAFSDGQWWTTDEILKEVARHKTPYVCVTGGEPLAQKSCPALLKALCDAGYSVSLETSGALDISAVDSRVSRIMDLKAPGSGESDKNRLENLAELKKSDEIKIVIADEADYFWAREMVQSRHLNELCPVLFSPILSELAPEALAAWILRDHLPVRMQLQMHRIIWGERTGV